ncbi:uncharacterized protein LOC101890147 [Musca domestica]|uniref:Uncharacterized protein LOC101890147 n=1 Tax=Musca domestica TaxID=7370 RepID=A0A9J7CTG4_MUSDO|nr:uncharacterized protein LOC101890147 [Musca domestica]
MKMEEIEYLEEYEDIVIRNSAINLGGAEDSKTPKPHEDKDDDGSSSSLDQDIFNCLFDDNSEDDNEEQQPKRDMPKPDQQRELRASLDSIDLINDLGEQVAKEFEISKAAAGQTKDTINSENNSSVTSNAKSCVRVNTLKKLPKVKETLTKKVVIPRKLNVINEKPEKTRNLSTTISLLSDKPRTKSLSKVGHLPTTSNVLKRSIVSKTSSVKQRPATIVKPEKIITKDPPEDPLNLDEISSTESANFSSVSDITGETYNSVSEFDDDDYDFTSHIENLEEDEESSNSQIIDISNDSSGSRSQFEFLRGSTPSPVVSEDRDMHSLPGTSKGRTSPKLMANHEIIKNLMKKEGRPKLLQLINEQEHLSKGCQKESIDDSKTGAPSSGGSPKPRDIESADSHDSYLSVVNEMLEESYAEAMKNSKHETMANQEVGAEMEISIEETTETSNLTDKTDVICAVKNEQAKKSNMVANPIRDSGKESGKTKGQSEIKQTETVLKPQSITSMVSEKITSTTPNQEKNKSAVHSANDERRTDRSIKSLGEKDENTNKKESKVPDFKADKDFTLDECGFQGFAEDINKMTEEASKEIQEPSSSNKSERHNKLPDNQEKTKIILANTTQLRETDFDNHKMSQSGEEASIEIQKPAFSKTSETHKKLSEKQVILENTTQLRGKEASREIQKSAISKKAETQGNLPENQDKSKKILVNKVQLRETNIDNNKNSQPKVSQDVSKITIRNPFVHRKVKNISTKDKIERTSTGSNKTPEKCPSADTIEATNEKSHLTKPNNTERRSTGNSEIVLKKDCHTLKHITVADKIKAVETPACSKAHQKNTKTFTKKLEKTSKKPCATVEHEMIGFDLKERKPNEAYKSQHAKENESKELSRDSEDKVENTSSEKLEVLTKAPNLRNLNCSKMEVPKTVLEINTEEKRTSDNNPRNMVQIKDNKSTATDKSNKSEEDAVIKNMTEIAKLNPDEPQETDVPIKALKAPVCQLSDSNSTSNQSETTLKNQLPSHKNNNDQHSAVEYAKPVNAQGNKLAEPIEKRPTLSKKECSTNSRDSDNKTDGTSQVVVTESKEKVMNKPFQVEINKVVDFESILVDNGEKQQSPDNRNTQDSPKGLDRTAIVKQIDQSKKSDHDTVNLKRNIRKIRSTTKQGSEELKETPKLQKPHDPSTDKNEDLAKCSPRKKKAANVLTGSEIMKDLEHLSITASESDSRGNTGKTPDRVTSINNKRARKANDNKEDALSKNRKNIVDFAESNSVKNIEDNIASPNRENVKRNKKQMEAMVEVPKSLKEKYDEASGSSNKHKISSSTNAALSSSSTESERKESLSDKQNINVGKGSHKSKKCEGFSDVVVEKKPSSREATSVDPMMDAQDANYKDYAVDNISEKVLPKQDIQKGESSLPEQQGNDEESLSKKKNEGVDQVRTLRKRALDTSTNESKNIELPKEPQADLEINKKRTLRSPAQKPANELAKRTKLDRSARMRNVATVKTPPIVTEPSPNSGVIIDAPSQHPISEQIKASLTTATSSNMASTAVGILRDSDTEQSITEIPKIVPEIKPGTENRSDTSLKAKSADNASPTKKVILSEKKRTKHSTKKNISDNIIPSSVLSFAEWLDKNKKVEPTEDKHIEDMNNCKSRKSAKTKGALSKHGIEIEDPEKRPHTIHGKKREHKQTPPEARLQNIDLAQDEKNSFAHKEGTFQTSSSRSRSRLKRRTIGNAQQTLNSRQQVDVVRPSSASPTKGDKNKKRTEIEKLIESMSKEMKDGGIEDLLNSSDHVKRQRAASKKNTSTDLATAPERSLAGKINSAGNKGNSICEFASKSSPIRPAMLDTKFKKPIAPKELNLYAVNNDSVLSIETEKALIDEIEIVNMNSNFLKPLKCAAPKELHQNETKTNKLGKTHMLSNKSAQAMRCRKLKVRINRRFVTKYMQSLEKDKVSEVLMQKGSGKHVKKKGAEHSAPLVVQKDRQSVVRVQTTAEMPVNCRVWTLGRIHSIIHISSTISTRKCEGRKFAHDITTHTKLASCCRIHKRKFAKRVLYK